MALASESNRRKRTNDLSIRNLVVDEHRRRCLWSTDVRASSEFWTWRHAMQRASPEFCQITIVYSRPTVTFSCLSDAINFSIGGFQHISFPSCIHAKINGCISEMSSASGPRDQERFPTCHGPGPYPAHFSDCQTCSISQKYVQNAFPARAPPWTPLEELTTLPQTP